jgi:eukaryotic-like serine/threonine-protein kinase
MRAVSIGAGTRIGPYEVTSRLGAGGMGEVWKARDTRLQRDVAVKVLLQASAADADRIRRFQQEARAVAALNHTAKKLQVTPRWPKLAAMMKLPA